MGYLGKTVEDVVGWETEPHDALINNRTGGATAIGQIVELDLALTATEATTLRFGRDASGYANAIVPSGVAKKMTIFAVCLAVAADNAKVRVRFFGKAKVIFEDETSTTVNPLVLGDEGIVTTGGHASVAAAASGRVVARAEEAIADLNSGSAGPGTGPIAVDAFFNGMPASA